jgi:hypothetical protein
MTNIFNFSSDCVGKRKSARGTGQIATNSICEALPFHVAADGFLRGLARERPCMDKS